MPLPTFDLVIYYEDTDFTGLVYHANYLKYFERAREQALGFCLIKKMYSQGVHCVVRRASMNCFKAATHGCSFFVQSSVAFSQSPRLSFHQSLYSRDSKMPYVTAEIELAVVNDRSKPIKIPALLLDKLNSII